MNGWKEISRLVDDDARCAKILNMEEEGLQTERHVLRSKAEYRRTPTVFGELHSTCCCRDCTAVLADIQQCCATCNEMKVNVVESANSCAYFAQNRNVRTLQVQSFHSVVASSSSVYCGHPAPVSVSRGLYKGSQTFSRRQLGRGKERVGVAASLEEIVGKVGLVFVRCH